MLYNSSICSVSRYSLFTILLLAFIVAGASFPCGVHAAWGKRSIDDFIAAAQQGDARDWAELGFIYLQGKDCAPQNLVEAHKWINKAVGAGHPLGVAALGLAHLNGQGVPGDRAKAADLFKQALPGLKKLAEKKHPRALSALAVMADAGIGMPKDPAKVFAWAKLGAEKGSPGAMVRLYSMYLNGRGVPKDKGKAFKWLKKAEGKGYSEAVRLMGDVYYRGSFDQKKDYRKALKLYEEAMGLGNSNAYVDAGISYLYGRGVEEDVSKTLELYRRGAEMGSTWAMRELGKLYKKGEHVKRDYAEAARWFEKAAKLSDSRGMVQLGLLVERGQGVEKDRVRALALYTQAAEKGNSWGMHNTGWMYEHGAGTKRDYAEAAKWYRKGAEKGHNNARVSLALMMYKGKGAKKDWPEALKLLKAAADDGQTRAKREYGLALTEWDGNGVSPDPAEGLKYLKAAAHAGDVRGMYLLGLHYPNLKEGRKWLEKAAEKGSTQAMMTLAKSVYRSEKEYDASCDLLEKAVQAKVASAYPELAQCYAKGEGREKNLARAEELLRQGIEAGNMDYSALVGILQAQKRDTGGMNMLADRLYCVMPSEVAHGALQDKYYYYRIPSCSYILGQDIHRGMNVDVEKALKDSIQAWEAGMKDIAMAQFRKAREVDPMVLYKLHPWMDMYWRSMPLEAYGRLLQDLEESLGNSFGFWFSYTNAAALAGHPDLVRYGVEKMQSTVTALKNKQARHMSRVAMAPYPAYALMLEGEADKAYTALYNAVNDLEDADKLDIARYCAFMLPLLRKEEKKFNFVLSQDPKAEILKGESGAPEPFVDLRTGEVVQPPVSPVSPKPKPGLVDRGGDASATVEKPSEPVKPKKKKNSVVLD